MSTPDQLTQIATDVAWLKEHAKAAEAASKEYYNRLATIEAEVKHLRELAPSIHLTELSLARFKANDQGEEAQRAKTASIWGILIATGAFLLSIITFFFGDRP